jgi:hypothetical protein
MTGSLEILKRDPRKKIAIVGKAPSSLGLAPYKDETWQIWTLSDLVLAKQAPRYDVQFELHELSQLTARQPYIDWLKAAKDKPLVIRDATPELPHGLPFPKDLIVEKYGRYFTNTVSWEIALAIEVGAEEIGVWGVDMAASDEYSHQRPSCEYFLGLAAGKGIKVLLPPQCDLCKCAGLYGFDAWQGDMFVKWRSRCAELQGRVGGMNETRDTAEREVAYLQGAIEHCTDETKLAELKAKMPQFEKKRDEAASTSLYLQGALEDCREYWGQWATHV